MPVLWRALGALSVVGCVATGGCTAIGAGIGGAASPGKDKATFSRSAVDRVPMGADVVVSTPRGAVRGKFAGSWPNADGTLDDAAIALRTSSGRLERVDVSDIGTIETEGQQSGVLAGAMVGAALDVTAMVLIASASDRSRERKEPNQDGGMQVGSCPLIFSLDGDAKQLDAEVLVATVFPGLDRTDVVRLDHATASGGTIELEVIGQLGETQHLDELALLTVDHGSDSEVVPTRSGELRIVSGLVAPRSARGFRGVELTAKLELADGDAWVSTPLGRDASRPGDLRDVVELEVVRPRGARQGTLVIRARNTPWAAHLEREMLAVEPSAVSPLYAAIENFLTVRSAVQAAMVRELGLHVQVEENGAWRSVDHVWPVGPATSRIVGVPLDLSRVAGETVRVRLESTPGLWSMDQVAIAFGKPRAAVARVLRPTLALDSQERDRRAELRAADRSYLDMPAEERLRVSFAAPPSKPGKRRSVLVKASGWYSVHPDPKRKARVDLLELVAVPGAFARFSIDDVSAHALGSPK